MSVETTLPDTQAQADTRNITIDRVGVSNIRYPIRVQDRANELQNTIATLTMTVELPSEFKGTHMSRFLEVLGEYEAISAASIETVLDHLCERLDAQRSHIDIEFPYFVTKRAPVTGAAGKMEYLCGLKTDKTADGELDRVMTLRVPVATLCPCSKAISEYGAHNQRGIVSIEVRTEGFVWFEELIERIEECASCALFPVLKRADEKWVTERAYDNPRFVEDLLREVAVRMQEDDRVLWYRIEVENQESIHTHNAFASIERDKRS